jgi:predicted transcriptional regulator
MNRLISGAPQILVFDGDKLVGILTKTDIIRLLQIRNKLGI